MIFKSSHSQMFYKTSVLKDFAKFTWKHLRPVTVSKRDSSSGVFLQILWFFKKTFRQLLLDFFQWTYRNQVFSIFEHVWFQHPNVMNIMNFAIEKLYFAKLTRVSFLVKLRAKGLQLYWNETFELSIIFRNLFDRILANSFFWNLEQKGIN